MYCFCADGWLDEGSEVGGLMGDHSLILVNSGHL